MKFCLEEIKSPDDSLNDAAVVGIQRAKRLQVHVDFIVGDQEALSKQTGERQILDVPQSLLTLSFTSSWTVLFTFHSFAVSSTSLIVLESV